VVRPVSEQLGVEELEGEIDRVDLWKTCIQAFAIGAFSLVCLLDPIFLPAYAVHVGLAAVRRLREPNARDLLGWRCPLGCLMTVSGIVLGVARPIAFAWLLLTFRFASPR
jgi:hypothetical protein